MSTIIKDDVEVYMTSDRFQELSELERLKLENSILKDQFSLVNNQLSDYFNDEDDEDELSLLDLIKLIFSKCKSLIHKDTGEVKHLDVLDDELVSDVNNDEDTSEDKEKELTINDYINMSVDINVYIQNIMREVSMFKLCTFIAAIIVILFIIFVITGNITIYVI